MCIRDRLYAIQHGVYKFHDEYWGNITPKATSMIRSLLTVDPTKRMTAQEALNCEWMNPGREEKSKKRSIQALIRNYERCSGKSTNGSTTNLLDMLANSNRSLRLDSFSDNKVGGSSSNLLGATLNNSSRRSRSTLVRPVRHQR